MTARSLFAAALLVAATSSFAADPKPKPKPDAPPPSPAAAAADAVAAQSAAKTAKDAVSVEDIRLFTAVFNLVRQAYVEKVDDHALMQAAIHGLLEGLDPHSEYLDSRQLEALTEDTSGSYEGLGIEVLTVDGTLRVVAPIDDTPAERAGIKAGDIILRIDGKAVSAEGATEAVERLRGKPGSQVVLSVMHEGQATPVDVTLKRETIRVASVRGRMLEPGYAYLRIAQFQSDTGGELKRRIEKLKKENKNAPFLGAVLDLRSNPGGLVTSAVEVSDDFLEGGVIVTTHGRLHEADLSFSATPGDLLDGAPLVVLVDNGTASAAEIVAGALKDHHRALLMGRRTFGKGSVQTVLPLDDEHAVKLTTARYYTPSGTSIQAEGIHPDIQLADLALAARDAGPSLVTSERDLPRHLKGTDEGKIEIVGAKSGDDAIPDDYALSEAVNVLKAMALSHKAPAAEKKG